MPNIQFQDDDKLKLLTVYEAEELTSRSVSAWRKDILEKSIAYVKLGRSVRIPLSEIKRLINAGWHESNAT